MRQSYKGVLQKGHFENLWATFSWTIIYFDKIVICVIFAWFGQVLVQFN